MSMLLARYSSMSASNLSTCNTLKSARSGLPRGGQGPSPPTHHRFSWSSSSPPRLPQLGLHACNICRGDPCVSLPNFPTTAIIFPERLPHHILSVGRGSRWPSPTSPPSAIVFIFSQSYFWSGWCSSASVRAGERPSLLRPLLSRVLVCNFTTALDSLPFSGVFYPKSLEGSAVKGTHFLLLP